MTIMTSLATVPQPLLRTFILKVGLVMRWGLEVGAIAPAEDLRMTTLLRSTRT